MYESAPREREGEHIEEVLPTAIYTTSSTGRGPAPLRPIRRAAGRAGGRPVLVLGALCLFLFVALVVALIF